MQTLGQKTRTGIGKNNFQTEGDAVAMRRKRTGQTKLSTVCMSVNTSKLHQFKL